MNAIRKFASKINDTILGVYVKGQSLVTDEDGAFTVGDGGFLWVVVAILAIVGLGIYIYTHTSVSK